MTVASLAAILDMVAEGNLEVKLPTKWIDENQRWKGPDKKVREEKRRKKEDQREKTRDNQKQKDAGARKGSKIAKHCVFSNWFVALEGRRFPKAAGACHNGMHFFHISTSKADLLSWTCASRHNGVHSLHFSISRACPTPMCFAHFDLKI